MIVGEAVVAIRPVTPGREQEVDRRRERRWLAGVTVLSAVLSVSYFGQGLWKPRSTWRGNAGDAEQFMWFLAWVPHAIGRGDNPLLATDALYPDGANLMWNTSVLLPAFVMSPITLTLGPVVAYNILLAIGPVVTTFTSHLALRRYVAHGSAAAVGALAFTFSPFLLMHAGGHLHLVLIGLLPVFCVLLDEIVVRQRRSPWLLGALFGLVCAAQLLTSEEVLALEGLMSLVLAVVLIACFPREVVHRIPSVARAALSSIAVFAPLAAYPIYFQLAGPRQAPGAHQKNFFVSDLMGFVRPVGKIVGPRRLPFAGNPAEWNNYLGVPLIAAALIAIFLGWRTRRVVRVATVSMLVFVVLTLGEELRFNGHRTGLTLPWQWFNETPLIEDVLPARMSVVVTVFAALLLAVFVDEVLQDTRHVVRAGGLCLVLLIAITVIPRGMRTTTVRTPDFFAHVEEHIPPRSVVLVLPYIFGPGDIHPMLWQANSGMHYRMSDGWLIVPGRNSGPSHPVRIALSEIQKQHQPPKVDAAARQAAFDYFDRHDVDRVVIADAFRTPGDYALAVDYLTRVLGRTADIRTADAEMWSVSRASG